MSLITIVYTDVDFSMEKNIYKDIPSLENENSIKNMLYNNLMIGSAERPFDNSLRLDIRDIIHENDNFLTRKQLKDAIQEAINKDRRILKMDKINFDTTELYKWEITVTLRLNLKKSTDEKVDLTLLIDRN